jgi:drug/metabolite transporter (DMT)-like permease
MSLLPNDNRTRAYLALAAICIIWGTTYTAIKYAIRDFPPYLLVGLRQTSGGLLLLAWVLILGKFRPMSSRYLALQFLTGLFTITGGNGFITWGMQHIPSGLASVIGSSQACCSVSAGWV